MKFVRKEKLSIYATFLHPEQILLWSQVNLGTTELKSKHLNIFKYFFFRYFFFYWRLKKKKKSIYGIFLNMLRWKHPLSDQLPFNGHKGLISSDICVTEIFCEEAFGIIGKTHSWLSLVLVMWAVDTHMRMLDLCTVQQKKAREMPWVRI